MDCQEGRLSHEINQLTQELQELMRYTRSLHRRLLLPDGDGDVLAAAGMLPEACKTCGARWSCEHGGEL